MHFGQTIVLAVLAVAAAASPILARGHQDWDDYKNCCDQRDNHGQHLNCKRPDKWGDDWHDKGDSDWSKWGQDGHDLWQQCHKDWKGQYNTWQQAKNKWYWHDKDKYDKEGGEWDGEQQMWKNERDNWQNGNCPKPQHDPAWNPDQDGWCHYSVAKVVLKCSVGVVIYKDYGGYGQPQPKWNPDKYGWYHFTEQITLKCSEKIIYKYYD